MITFNVQTKTSQLRPAPKTGDLFIDNMGDLCMVRIPESDERLDIYPGIPYAHLTGPHAREGRFYMKRSVFDVCTHVELEEPMKLREV